MRQSGRLKVYTATLPSAEGPLGFKPLTSFTTSLFSAWAHWKSIPQEMEVAA